MSAIGEHIVFSKNESMGYPGLNRLRITRFCYLQERKQKALLQVSNK